MMVTPVGCDFAVCNYNIHDAVGYEILIHWVKVIRIRVIQVVYHSSNIIYTEDLERLILKL